MFGLLHEQTQATEAKRSFSRYDEENYGEDSSFVHLRA